MNTRNKIAKELTKIAASLTKSAAPKSVGGVLATGLQKVPVGFPVVMAFTDYHEVSPMADTLSGLTKKKVKSRELHNHYGEYIAIFYLIKDEAYKKMIQDVKKKFPANDDED